MSAIVIKNAQIINENKIFYGDVLIENERIMKIDSQINVQKAHQEINAENLTLMPGVIDDQVHFREPGLTHKGNIYSESRAAVAGGTTSFIEQPNTVPNATSHEVLEEKYVIASKTSFVNYSFMLGGTNNNLEEIKKTNPTNIAGIKLFLGSSTGNMLVDNDMALEQIFLNTSLPIATHCEDETTVKRNTELFIEKYGNQLQASHHPLIRSHEACYLSSSKTVALAKKTGARLHVFHLSTAEELALFRNDIPLSQKKITAEVCIHHLWFTAEDYAQKGNFIKWNPAIKNAADRDALWEALLNDTIDVIATDHAPHTFEEKSKPFMEAPSGGPLVQHSLVAMLDKYHEGKITLEKIVQKMMHNPAILFNINDRGYIREGYYADLTLVDLNKPWAVDKSNLLYHCGWSPFEGHKFQSKVKHTFVNGHHVYNDGHLKDVLVGKRLLFNR
jgi:dihydroorotase